MRCSLALLALLVFTSTAALAQSERGGKAEVPAPDKLGNFEIQDLMVRITYANDTQDARGVPAQVTVRPLEGDRLETPRLYLGGALGDEIRTIELRPSDDGTLVGEGMLPPLSQVEAFHLRMDREGKNGLTIGMPPNVREDFEGGARGEGIKIEISMDWPLDVDIVIET
ncbi:MAG: hypothetical protein AAGI52_10880 [Bacteroidota bacterium]